MVCKLSFLVLKTNIVRNFGSISKGFFELFSLFFLCLDATKFVLLSVFTVIETICPKTYLVARNFCGSLFLRLAIFCYLRELILRLGQIGFSCWELIFAIFRKYPGPSIDNIFVFVKYVR